MLKSYISLPETVGILQPPRINALASAIHNALNTWNTAFGPAQMVLDGSARAIVINQHWYYFAKLALCDDPDITWGIDQGQRFLVIDERIILRFKLIDRNFESKNYPTKRASQLRLQYPLKGLPEYEWLEVGYRLDITGTVLQDAFVLLRIGNQIPWLWQIGGNQIDEFPVQLPLRPPATPEPYVFKFDSFV